MKLVTKNGALRCRNFTLVLSKTPPFFPVTGSLSYSLPEIPAAPSASLEALGIRSALLKLDFIPTKSRLYSFLAPSLNQGN